MEERQFQAQNSRSFDMTFPTKFARAIVPAAIVVAAPALAAEPADMAHLKAHITGVHTMTADFLQTDARARDPSQYGSLTLVFLRSGSAPGGLQLYGWTAIDGQNRRTTVKLTNVHYNVAVPGSAFTYREPKKK
jgi:outer membrane lipoprotein-sorting protein